MSGNSECPYCKGSLFINQGYVKKVVNGHRAIYPYAQPCHCSVNQSLNRKFGILSQVPDATPDDSDKIHELYGPGGKTKGNLIFHGDEPMFFYMVKCYFLKGFTHQDYQILEGVHVVERYNVPKEDGSRLTVSFLDQYDLLVVLFTSRAEPPTLKACIADLIKNRQRIGKPTWVYAPNQETFKTAKEYSADLEPYFSTYGTVVVDVNASFSGYSSERSEKAKIKSSRKVQDHLGSI